MSGISRRLIELTVIKHDFEAEIGRHPAGSARRARLDRDYVRVRQAQDAESARLLRAGTPAAGIARRIRLIDPEGDRR